MTPVGPRCPDHATAGKPSNRPPLKARAPRTAHLAIARGEPVVTYSLIALNVVIYLITVAQGAGFDGMTTEAHRLHDRAPIRPMWQRPQRRNPGVNPNTCILNTIGTPHVRPAQAMARKEPRLEGGGVIDGSLEGFHHRKGFS